MTYEKMKRISAIKLLKMAIKKQKGLRIDESAYKRRREIVEIEIQGKSISQLEEMQTEAIKAWIEFKEETKQKKENRLMDLYPHDIAADTEENRKRRQKAINIVKKAQYQQQTFTVLSKEVGKGNKNSLKRLYVQEPNDNSYRQINERQKIEKEILRYNQ